MEKKIVIPGDFLSDNSSKAGDGTYVSEGKVYSKLFGLVSEKDKILVVSLSGKYLPSIRDVVIGTVVEISYSNWFLNINSPYEGRLNISEFSKRIEQDNMMEYLNIGDSVVVMVKEVTPSMKVELTMRNHKLGIIADGRIFKLSPSKVPRVIGRSGSMISMMKKETNCNIVVGQNGIVWVTGKDKDVDKAIESLHIIEKEAHTKGLTDRVSVFLKNGYEKKPVDSTNLEILNELLD